MNERRLKIWFVGLCVWAVGFTLYVLGARPWSVLVMLGACPVLAWAAFWRGGLLRS